jgi:acyl-CoA dehydrogenase family protein 9
MDDQQKKLLEELLFSGEKKLSFAKLLYFGSFHTPSVMPFPSLSAEEAKSAESLVSRVESFADQYIDGARFDRESSIPMSVIKGLGDIGLLGATIPKQYGGQGLTQTAYCRAMSTLAQRCGSTALFVNAHQSIGLKALVLFGTDKQKERWLPSLASGDTIAAFSLTEPNAGSDASGIETRATYDPDKKVYVLSGQKQWTTNGSLAGVLTVMAQTEILTPQGPRDKVTAFLVTPDMPGFIIKDRALDKVGMRGSTTSNLIFDNVEVPEENVLGPKGGGLKVCLTVLDYGRTTFGATCSGPARYLLNRAIVHARSRYQFKKPLASFPLVKKKIAMMAALTYAMEATTELTAGLVDKGMEEFMLESAILKVFNSEALWNIIYETMQIFGGRSFFTDQPFERMMRDARLNMIGEGSNEVLRAFIAAVGLRDVGLQFQEVTEALKHPISQFGVLKMFSKQGASYLRAPVIPVHTGHLAHEANMVGRAIRRFAVANARVLAKYREDIIEHQMILNRVADMAIALYTSIAVISKLDTQLIQEKEPNKQLEQDIAAGKLYIQHAMDIIEKALATLVHNYDDAMEELSDQLTGLSE